MVKKQKQAIGLSYNEMGQTAPIVSTKATDDMAQAVIDMANELGIYVHKDENLLAQLDKLKEGEQVPQELFTIIATILSFSYLLQGKTPQMFKRKDGSTAINIKT